MKKVVQFSIFVVLFLSFVMNKETSATFDPGYTRDSLTGLVYDSLLTLSGATKVTAVQSGSADDGSMFINLPFTFQYNGTNYTRVTVSTNGWIAMDSITSTQFTPNLFTTTAAPLNVIAGWFRDNNLNTANQGMWVHEQKIIGSDTIYIIEYRNFSGAAGGGTSATLQWNAQVWLYKTSNKIEMRYGPILGAITQSAALGLKDNGVGAAPHFYNALTNNSTSTTLSSAWPGAGNGYRYNPILPLVNDVGTTAILNPVNGGASGNQAPSATIKNFGSATQSGYNVICTISPGGYSNTQVAPSLVSGATTNINFANVNLAPNVAYTVTVYTDLSNDENRSNDTQRVVVVLINANYGNDSGYFYANNLATDQPSFPEWCWKDTSGSISMIDSGVVQPGNTFVGNTDDGYFKQSLSNILLAFGIDPTNKYLKYNGVCYDSIFPGTNGIIGFTEAFGTYSLSDFNIDGAQVAKNALLPIWHDANFANIPTGSKNRLSYKAQGSQLIFTYDRAVSFAPTTDWVSYQVTIEIVTGCGGPNSNFKYTFADTTNGNTSASFLANYLAQYPVASGLVTVFRNYVSGFSQNGAPIAYAGYVSAANPFPATPVTQINVKRPLFNLTTGAGLAIEYGPNQNSLNELTCSKKSPFKISIALQGLQSNGNPVGSTPRVRDTVTINIRDGAPAPYAIIQQYKVLLDSAHNGSYAYGYTNLDFAWDQDSIYYLEILHRNSVFAWSNLISSSTDSISYDFTTGVGKIFGNNGILINGAASFYTGDVDGPVEGGNQDGCVDLTDILNVYNESSVFASGPYVLADLNYDGTVDLSDIILVYNNANAFVCGIAPPGADNVFARSIIRFVPDRQVIILPDPYLQEKVVLTEKEALIRAEEKK